MPGVMVFGYMTHPLVSRHGLDWLHHGQADVLFMKPAYEAQTLQIQADFDLHRRSAHVEAFHETELLAKMQTGFASSDTQPDPRSFWLGCPPITERPVIDWDQIRLQEPFPAMAWKAPVQENLTWCRESNDGLKLYQDTEKAYLHPGLILRQANLILRQRYIIPAWIHTQSQITFFSALRVAQDYEVRAFAEDKWERKGHQFLRLHVAILKGTQVCAEIKHTALFKLRHS